MCTMYICIRIHISSVWEAKLSEHQIRGSIGGSAAVLQSKGLRKRISCSQTPVCAHVCACVRRCLRLQFACMFRCTCVHVGRVLELRAKRALES